MIKIGLGCGLVLTRKQTTNRIDEVTLKVLRVQQDHNEFPQW